MAFTPSRFGTSSSNAASATARAVQRLLDEIADSFEAVWRERSEHVERVKSSRPRCRGTSSWRPFCARPSSPPNRRFDAPGAASIITGTVVGLKGATSGASSSCVHVRPRRLHPHLPRIADRPDRRWLRQRRGGIGVPRRHPRRHSLHQRRRRLRRPLHVLQPHRDHRQPRPVLRSRLEPEHQLRRRRRCHRQHLSFRRHGLLRPHHGFPGPIRRPHPRRRDQWLAATPSDTLPPSSTAGSTS